MRAFVRTYACVWYLCIIIHVCKQENNAVTLLQFTFQPILLVVLAQPTDVKDIPIDRDKEMTDHAYNTCYKNLLTF